MKILVTGGAGFIGSHVTDYLINKGHDVTVLDDLSGGLEENINSGAKFVKGSITDSTLVEKVMEGNQVVYHFAAYAAEGLSHFIRRFNYINNLIGSVNLINSAIRNNIKTFLFSSSMAVYGTGNPPFNEDDPLNPEDPYGISKYAVERDLKAAHESFGLEYVVIRPHNIFGERQFLGDPYRNVIGIWMNNIMKDQPILIYGDGTQTRAFSYIRDIVPCIGEAPFTPLAKNNIINLGSGPDKACTLKDLSEYVRVAMNAPDHPIVHTPPRYEVKHAYCTTEKSEDILGFKDRTILQEGLKKMANWALKRGPMEPIVWSGYELTEQLPQFWKDLPKKFPNPEKRINPFDEYLQKPF